MKTLSREEMKNIKAGMIEPDQCLYCACFDPHYDSCWYRKDTGPGAGGECGDIYPHCDNGYGFYGDCGDGCTMS